MKKENLLREFAMDEDFIVRKNVAKDINTPAEILDLMADDSTIDVKHNIVCNPNASAETLRKIFENNMTYHLTDYEETDYIKSAIENNPNLPYEIIKEYANSEKGFIRRLIAGRKNLPKDIAKKLSKDKEATVRMAIARTTTYLEALEDLSNDEDDFVRIDVARNPFTPQLILEKLSNDKDKYVRGEVAENNNTPLELLLELFNEEDEWVKKSAKLGLIKKEF